MENYTEFEKFEDFKILYIHIALLEIKSDKFTFWLN